MSIFALLLLLTLVSTTSSYFTDENILKLVKHSCEIHNHHVCLKEKYLSKSDSIASFDQEKILTSQTVKDLKNDPGKTVTEAAEIFKKEFCCEDAACFKLCGLNVVEKKDIIKNLPKFYKELFALGFEELKPYEVDYIFFLKHQHHHHKHLPIQVEELYDLLHEHEQKYVNALKEKGVEF